MLMAARRFYAYYIRGKQLALVEHDNVSGSGQTLGQPSLDDIGPSGALSWKSPIATVADGLEIEYAYSPRYFIKQTNITHTTITHYRTNAGYLQIKGGSVNYDDTTDADDFIVLRNAGTFNGLHKITSYDNVDATKDAITLDTKYSGSTAWSAFEETVTLYYRVDALSDESDTIDLPEYLAKALVYYVKAKVAEDQRDIELKEYLMREFRMMVEKQESSKIWGARLVVPASNAIR